MDKEIVLFRTTRRTPFHSIKITVFLRTKCVRKKLSLLSSSLSLSDVDLHKKVSRVKGRKETKWIGRFIE